MIEEIKLQQSLKQILKLFENEHDSHSGDHLSNCIDSHKECKHALKKSSLLDRERFNLLFNQFSQLL